jgi:DNA-binding FrmR family transcriptional regulator
MAHTHTHLNKVVLNRLARIEGQVKSIRSMVESGRLILEDHMEHCILDAVDEGRGQEALEDLKVALKQFIK